MRAILGVGILGLVLELPMSVELLEVRRIWDAAPHNAFTDLIRFREQWYCVFREGQAHVSPDGAIRVLTSPNGREWSSAARLASSDGDLRDPKLSVTPSGMLMLTAALAFPQPAMKRHETRAWFSADGRHWNTSFVIGEPDFWLWRVTWHPGGAFGIAYETRERAGIRLYASEDGRRFLPIVSSFPVAGSPSEASLLFLTDGSLLAILRRDGDPASALLGRSEAPYTDWSWTEVGARLGGPHMIRIPDGRIVVAGRRYDSKVRTSLMWLDLETARLEEFLVLPSGGDTSYPGLVWHDDSLWISYYSSHEGKSSIYLAQVRL